MPEEPQVARTWRPCTVRALLVADGALSFGDDALGLGRFVAILQGADRSDVRFELTLAHLRADATGAEMMAGSPGIARRLRGFLFDDPSHFAPDMYDEVWLFGHAARFDRPSYATRSDARRHPPTSLGPDELLNLSGHMNRGGGVFATGDHGSAGSALGAAVNRVRGMRSWDPDPAGRRAGRDVRAATDDPPRLDVRLYRTSVGVLGQARYPHPVLCGRQGCIDVLRGTPAAPHEAECREPAGVREVYLDGSPEYPPALDGSGTVTPEVIARDAEGRGIVAAYDGHRSGVGRAVCDATWHHFVSAEGAEVAEYFVNIGIWLAPPARHRGIRARLWWHLVWSARTVEAVLHDPGADPAAIDLGDLFVLGGQARRALAARVPAGQVLDWTFPVIGAIWPEILPWVDPWGSRRHLREEGEPLLPWIDLQPVVDVVLGGALVAVRQALPHAPPSPAAGEDPVPDVAPIAAEGARRAFSRVARELAVDLENLGHLVTAARRRDP